MTTRNIQKHLSINHLIHAQADSPRYGLEFGNTSLLSRFFPRVRDFLTETSQRYNKEAENHKAIEHLQAMSDQELNDIGIKRPDISRAVHFGNDNI